MTVAKVWLKNQDVLKYLKHPVSKVGFRDANAYAIWPDDSFTARRIRDGDVTIEDPGAGATGATGATGDVSRESPTELRVQPQKGAKGA
jgi:hypothetical protein